MRRLSVIHSIVGMVCFSVCTSTEAPAQFGPCVCGMDVNGNGVCFGDVGCAEIELCSVDDPCPDGQVCIVNNCCTAAAPGCFPTCGTACDNPGTCLGGFPSCAPTGACCADDEKFGCTCFVLSPGECEDRGGTYEGDDTVCDDAACTEITCPGDITVNNDEGECGAVVEYMATGTDACGDPVELECTPESGSTFPVGMTTVTCGAGDGAGGCSTITHSASQTVVSGTSAACTGGGATTDTSWWRAFNLPAFGIAGDFDVQSVDFGVEVAVDPSGSQTVTVNLYTNTGGAFPSGMRNPIGSAMVNVADQSLTIVNVPVTGTAPAGSELVVEIASVDHQNPDGSGVFFIGANSAGQTGPSYISAPDCGVAIPTDLALFGFPNSHTVLSVIGCEGVGCTFKVTVNDTEPPMVSCPDPITLDRGDKICNGDVQDWLDQFTATDNCPGVTFETDAPECGFPAGTTTKVTLTAEDAAGNMAMCMSEITIDPAPRVTFDQKGSLLIFSKVEIKWDAAGSLVQDTFLDFTNDYPAGVSIQAYFINGDVELAEVLDGDGEVIQEFEPGWNTADCRFALTANQPHFWSAANGSDKCQPFDVLDEDGPGRPDPEASSVTRILRGYVIMWAVRFNAEENIWEEIRWNHLKGDAVIVNYENGTAWEYNAWSTQARCGTHGEPLLDCIEFDENGVCCDAEVIPGRLDLDGFQYDIAFDTLLLDFYGSGSTVLSGGGVTASVNTDLTVHAVEADLRQDGCGPVLTKVEAEIWNEFESKFSGTRRCVCCWDQTMLSDWSRSEVIPNHFKRAALRTDKGKARLDGVYSTECDYEELCGEAAFQKMWNCGRDSKSPPYSSFSQNAAILGLATKFIAFSGGLIDQATAGMNLVGMGEESARIRTDLDDGTEELQSEGDPLDAARPTKALPSDSRPTIERGYRSPVIGPRLGN